MGGAVLVFDLDGTLTDSVPNYTRACGEAWRLLAAEGSPVRDDPPTTRAVAGLMGRPTAAIWAGLMPGAPEAVRRRGAELARASFHAELEDRGPVLFAGAAAALGELTDEGHSLHVLSNGSEAYIELVLRRSGLDALVRSAASALGTGKVAAAGRLAAASPGRTLVMVGDRAEDVQAGRAHGFALGCAYGYGAEGELEGAHYLVRRSEDLAAGVRRLLLLARLQAAIPEVVGRPVLIGITGPDCAGKPALAGELARFLAAEGQRASVVPAPGETRHCLAGPGEVVLVEGVCLFRPELEGLFDLTVYVEANMSAAECKPKARADIVVDNADWRRPGVKPRRAR